MNKLNDTTDNKKFQETINTWNDIIVKLMVQKNIDLQQVSNWNICAFFYKKTVSIIDSLWTSLIDIFDVDMLAKCLSNHNNDYILKPLNKELLLSKMLRHLGQI